MKYKVRCTHIISHLRNVRKYQNKPINEENGESYIEVHREKEAYAIRMIEHYMWHALHWYEILIEETEK